MPFKPRQAAQKQSTASNAPGPNSQVSAKSKSGAQQQPTESHPAQYPDPNAFLPPTLASLRRDWRWAAVSQFLYTFQGPLRIDPYIEVELEEDLAYGTDVALSKIVHRLLFTLAGDRKITPQNWMGYLQGQYARRYTPHPNPFLQDMLPPSHPSDDEKPTETKESESGRDTPSEPAPDSELPAETKPDDLPNGSPNEITTAESTNPNGTPAPVDDTKPQEANEATVPAPEPAIKLQPMRQWSDLSQSEQLDVLWTLCEWQFTGVMRLRNLLGEEDSGVGWRMEPVGWDSKKNTYWLVGETRLWVQHPLPQPPKLPPKKKGRSTQTVVVPLEPTIFSRAPPSFDSDSENDNQRNKAEIKSEQESTRESSRSLSPPPPTRPKRGTATKEKRRTDEGTNGSRKRAKVAGTRVSLRLRGSGKDKEDEQSAPDEELEAKATKATEDPFGSDSDLTEVDELEREIEAERKKRETVDSTKRRSGRRKGKPEVKPKVEESEAEQEEEPVQEEAEGKAKQLPVRLKVAPPVDPMLPPPLPPGFVEWETVCASLHDWETFPARFEKATNPNEKAFRSYLNKVLIPAVTTNLKAQLKVRKLETAVQNRKRSSRLAIKESIIEAQRQEEGRRAAELELHARARRQEERERRQEEEMLKRERDREEKIRSREARAGRRTGWDGSESGSASPAPTPEVTSDPPVKIRLRTGRVASATPIASPVESPPGSGSVSAPGSGTTSRTDELWELLCEGCGKQGWNTDDGSQLVKCESCGRWSHTACHDRADELAGTPKRDWSAVDFTCRACSNTARKPGVNGGKSNGISAAGYLVPQPNGGIVPGNATPNAQPVPSPAYMYAALQAAPNGHVLQQPPYSGQITPPVYPVQNQPRPPVFAPFVHSAQLPPPIPIPQFQTPVPPLSQPPLPQPPHPHQPLSRPPMYPYVNGHGP